MSFSSLLALLEGERANASRRLSKQIESLLAAATRTAVTTESIPPAHEPKSKSNLMSPGAAAEMEATMARLSLDSNSVPRVRIVRNKTEGEEETPSSERRKSLNVHGLHLTLNDRRTSV